MIQPHSIMGHYFVPHDLLLSKFHIHIFGPRWKYNLWMLISGRELKGTQPIALSIGKYHLQMPFAFKCLSITNTKYSQRQALICKVGVSYMEKV